MRRCNAELRVTLDAGYGVFNIVVHRVYEIKHCVAAPTRLGRARASSTIEYSPRLSTMVLVAPGGWRQGCAHSAHRLTCMQIDIGSRLKHSRLNTGLSQRALAKKAGVTNGLISQIEQNRISPSIASLKKILDVLSLSLADFFTTDDGRAPDFFYERKQLPNLGSGDVAIFLVGAGIRHRAM